jgi:phytoene dehydrogenase-like protein
MTAKRDGYDAIIVGAGVGGLSAGALLAKEGLRVLILEQNDRVGGRALSIQGREICDHGPQWYKDLLATQYSYIAGAQPGWDALIGERMLDGYTLDVGYHAVSANGVGYMLDFEEAVGGLEHVVKHGGRWASHYQDKIYLDAAGTSVDPQLKAIAIAQKIPYLDFYTDPHALSDEDIDRLETVSFKTWADGKGISRNDIIYNHLHTVSTLFSTINNPEDISIGDIFRYFKHAFGTKIARGLTRYNGGFVEGGVMNWSQALADRFRAVGGELKLHTRVRQIRVQGGRVTGVEAVTKGGTAAVFQAPRVVSNIPAQQTFRVIDPAHFPAEWVARTRSMYGYGSYTPYMGLNRLVMPEEEARLGLKNTCVLPKEAGFDYDVYICWNIQSALDPSVAPPGKHLLCAYLPMTEKEAHDRRLVQKLVDRLPDFLEAIYPGFTASIDWKLDLVCWKLEGVAKSISQAGTQKVPVRSRHVEGLYFAGDTAKGYGVAMDCAIASGMICAGDILHKDFGIR